MPDPRGLQADVVPEEAGCRLRLSGEFDLGSVPAFLEAAGRTFDFREVVLDLGDLTFIDSVALREIVDLATVTRRDGRAFRVTGTQPAVRRVVAISGLDEVLGIADAP